MYSSQNVVCISFLYWCPLSISRRSYFYRDKYSTQFSVKTHNQCIDVGRPTTLSKVRKPDGYRLVVNSQVPGEDDRLAREGLLKQIEGLQERLETQAREYKEAIESGLEDRRRLAEEYEYVKQKDMDKVKTATEKLVCIFLDMGLGGYLILFYNNFYFHIRLVFLKLRGMIAFTSQSNNGLC